MKKCIISFIFSKNINLLLIQFNQHSFSSYQLFLSFSCLLLLLSIYFFQYSFPFLFDVIPIFVYVTILIILYYIFILLYNIIFFILFYKTILILVIILYWTVHKYWSSTSAFIIILSFGHVWFSLRWILSFIDLHIWSVWSVCSV